MDISSELVDQNSEGCTEDFSKTVQEEWRTISENKKKVPPEPTTRPVTRASKLVFK